MKTFPRRFRLKYLLSQSDIFAHFGTGKSTAPAPSAQSKGADTDRRAHRTAAANEDLDDDERALLKDEESEEVSARGTLLLMQPTLVSGGQLRLVAHTITCAHSDTLLCFNFRDYQLEGLNWMIKLQENGINGILADEVRTSPIFSFLLTFTRYFAF